ncbi:MAG: hypothetical protein Q8Q49_00670 [bacterium]|nr:hypothetical protein [bacterium]
MVEDGRKMPQDLTLVQTLSRTDLASLSSLSPQEVTTQEEAMQELLRGLSAIPLVAGIGVFPYERRSHMKIFLSGLPSNIQFWQAGQQGNKVSYQFDIAMRRFRREMAISYVALGNRNIEEAVLYLRDDHPDLYPNKDDVAKIERGDLPEGMSGQAAMVALIEDAYNFGSLTDAPTFVKFE